MDPQRYSVAVTARGYADIADGYSFTGEYASSAIAEKWLDGLEASILSLSTLPHRYPEVSGISGFHHPLPRVLIYRRTKAAQAWQVIYRIYEFPEQHGDFVQIIAVRHGAKKPMTRREARDIDDSF